jgi:DNA-binding LacI/PurR family transcriptional regulator
MVTVFDVARLAGVSSATVSRALSGKPEVSPSTRARVLSAVEAIGYKPNFNAQALRLGRSRTVGLVVGDIRQGGYAALTSSLQESLAAIGCSMLMFDMQHQEERLSSFLDRTRSLGLAAIVIAMPHVMSAATRNKIRTLSETGLPTILQGQTLAGDRMFSVRVDDREMAAKAVGYLARAGRTPIGYLGRVSDSAIGQDRFQGYVAGIKANGLAFDPALVWDTGSGYRYAVGRQELARALDAGLRFRGVLAASDELALGAMSIALDRRKAVPEEMAFVGFGANPWAEYVRPSLTTVTTHPDEVGKVVAEIVGRSLDGKEGRRHYVLPGSLVVRESA